MVEESSGGGQGWYPRKGVSGRISRELQRILEQEYKPGSADRRTWAEVLAKVIVLKAAQGSFAHMRELIERTEGKVPERLAGPDGGPLGAELIAQAMARIYPQAELVQAGIVDVKAITGGGKGDVDARAICGSAGPGQSGASEDGSP